VTHLPGGDKGHPTYGDHPEIDAIWRQLLGWKNRALNDGPEAQRAPIHLFEALELAMERQRKMNERKS
jgi:hypothetical protein